MKKLKRLKIIEEGRLTDSEMNELVGGLYSCSGGPYETKHCGAPDDKSTSSCPKNYWSCSSFWNYGKVCTLQYVGPTGPGGLAP